MRISPEQLKQMEHIYLAHATITHDNYVVDHLFSTADDDQISASAIMAQQGLDIDSRERLDNRWSHQWSLNSGKSEKAKTRRILYLW